jgi:hypothetical protein
MIKMILSIAFLSFLVLAPEVSGAVDFLYKNYEAVLKQHARTGVTIDGISVTAVDYAALASDAKKPHSPYSLLLEDLAAFNPASLGSREQKMAFWINVYNIAAIKTIVDHYPVDSIRSMKISILGVPWSKKIINVGGKEYSLGENEFEVLVEGFKDLRIHFGINCASVSCVNLLPKPYRGSNLYKQLEDQGKQFLADPNKGLRIDRKEKKVYLSEVFKFDKKHFDAYAGGAMKFLLPYVKPADREFLRTGHYSLEYLDYDWKVNDVKYAQEHSAPVLRR